MKVRRLYHIDTGTAVFISVTVLMAVGAITSGNNLLFVVFGLAIGAIVVSGVLGGSVMMGLRAERECPPVAGVGEPLAIRYRVTNASRFFPAFALLVEEREDRRPRRGGSLGARVIEALRSPQRETPRRRLIGEPCACVLHVGPSQSVTATTVVTPRARGEIALRAVSLSSAFPFGLFRKIVVVRHPQSILVHPRPVVLRREVLADLLAGAHAGWRSHPRKGLGDEFFGLREYRDGDSPRSIAWKRSARTGQLFVREFSQPRARALGVVLNLPQGAADEAGEEKAIALAAGIISEAIKAGVDVGLYAPAFGIAADPAPGHRQRSVLMSHLARIDLSAPRSRAAFASPGADQSAWVAVHSGAPDPLAAPAEARHLSVNDLDAIEARQSAVAAITDAKGERS